MNRFYEFTMFLVIAFTIAGCANQIDSEEPENEQPLAVRDAGADAASCTFCSILEETVKTTACADIQSIQRCFEPNQAFVLQQKSGALIATDCTVKHPPGCVAEFCKAFAIATVGGQCVP